MDRGKPSFLYYAPWLITVILILINHSTTVLSVSFNEDIRITREQKIAIDKLRERVLPHIIESYMKEDIYLVKWLRTTNFDISTAEKRFVENIRWRKANRMNEDEDFSDVVDEFSIVSSGFDKEGRPLVIAFAGDWDLRGAVVTGRATRLLHYLDKVLDLTARRIRDSQRQGKNVTQAVLVVDMGQFSLVTHACPQCLLRIVDFLLSYESHFPGLADKVIFTQASPTIAVVLQLVKNFGSKELNNAIQVYGTDKARWQKALLGYIDRQYLPVEMGGTWDRNLL